jgi:hypothetical protein
LAWDSYFESKIYIFSVATGDLLCKFEPEVIGLGIKKVSIAPTGSVIAAGLFDQGIALYNNISA